MKEVRSPKRPMIFYYCMVLLIIFLFNILIAPLLGHSQVTEVGYNTFMDMIDEKDIGLVQIEDTEIIFTNKEQSKTYETTAMEDPGLAERLHNCGAEFERIIEEPVSPLFSILLTTVLPILIFIALGRYMSKK